VIQDIGLNPSLDADGLRCFQETMKVSRCYLEYGSGGSTFYAIHVAGVPHVISVESDLAWSKRIRTLAAASTISSSILNIVMLAKWETGEFRKIATA
jgi:hypothetical protein